ncbi:hypothetical protein FITA111629_04990 [Filibacter tadaridae]|uniref:Stage III sporulation protein AD n=1 Tax=Filibacter tadaridae TaxID=2483811 RepID=A0A3P5XCG3_9BACL|nr:hypothetical protein [Filibacter tadaridae]VDC32405.1 hypothetical protein FILTAD_02634 [Filibacter tadaridae]
MLTLLQTIVVFLILLLISFTVPKLQPLLYTAIFLLFFFYLLMTVIFPFSIQYVELFEPLPDPFARLLIGSAILYFISDIISKHIAEAGYGSLATISHFAVKITILTLWIQQTTELVEILSTLITK